MALRTDLLKDELIEKVVEAVQTRMSGLYAFSGKATGFLGPIALAAVTTAFDSQRVGMGVIIVFFVAGLLLLLRVRES